MQKTRTVSGFFNAPLKTLIQQPGLPAYGV